MSEKIIMQYKNIGWIEKMRFVSISDFKPAKLSVVNGCLRVNGVGFATFKKKATECKIQITNEYSFKKINI
jgi:hypothetical protein